MKQRISKKLSLLLLFLLSALSISACTTLGYYSQAVSGHASMMTARQDIAKLLQDPELDAELRAKLEKVEEIRRYASTTLGLPENKSYSSYADIGRDYVTWNVVAAEEFSIQPLKWCFPVAGCVSYKGYFKEAGAEALSNKLREKGFDTTINGAIAYSTLGWFADPVLNTMLRGHDIRLASLIFHELAHQKLYVRGDSAFNEAYATFVEQAGVRAWLKSNQQLELLDLYAQRLAQSAEFSALLMRTRGELEIIYADTSRSDDAMRQAKAEAFQRLRDNYELYKQKWSGFTGYDHWFKRELNNARLVATATYRRLVPAFEAIFHEQGDSFEAFYKEAERLAELSIEDREAELKAYLPAASLLSHRDGVSGHD